MYVYLLQQPLTDNGVRWSGPRRWEASPARAGLGGRKGGGAECRAQTDWFRGCAARPGPPCRLGWRRRARLCLARAAGALPSWCMDGHDAMIAARARTPFTRSAARPREPRAPSQRQPQGEEAAAGVHHTHMHALLTHTHTHTHLQVPRSPEGAQWGAAGTGIRAS